MRLLVCLALVLTSCSTPTGTLDPRSNPENAPAAPEGSATASGSPQAPVSSSAPSAAPPGGSTKPAECARDASLASPLAVPEASGATEITIGGTQHILVVGDSKNAGAGILVPLAGGAPKKIALPIDGSVDDDVEGLATTGGALYALTSAGAVMRFTIDGGSIRRDGAAYRIGASPYSCSDLDDKNCGKNWEGLCLRREPKEGACAGYAASKAEGALYCVTIRGGKLAIDTGKKPIALGLPKESLSDCAFGKEALVVTTNDANGSKTYVVDESDGKKTELAGAVGHVSNEAIAIGSDGSLFVFEDSSSSTSAAARFRCNGL